MWDPLEEQTGLPACNRFSDVSANSIDVRENGAGDRDRTGDIQLGKLAFYR
jgi:hypothetical protein